MTNAAYAVKSTPKRERKKNLPTQIDIDILYYTCCYYSLFTMILRYFDDFKPTESARQLPHPSLISLFLWRNEELADPFALFTDANQFAKQDIPKIIDFAIVKEQSNILMIWYYNRTSKRMVVCWNYSLFIFDYLRSDLIPALARLQVHDLAHADLRCRATKMRWKTVKS